MINPGHKLLTAWFTLLNGNITYNSANVPVYRTDVPEGEMGAHIILRLESSTDKRNNQSNVTMPVLITEVVTRYDTMINDAEVFEIDTAIGELLSSNPWSHNLPIQTDIQVVTVVRRDQTVLPEDDGVSRYNRLITRNVHRVLETK